MICSLLLTACSGEESPTNPSSATPSASTPAVVVSDLRIEASFVGGATVEGVVTLREPAATGGVVVALSADSTVVTVPANVTVAAGNASASFPVVTAVVTRTANITVTARVGDTVKTTAVRLRIDP